MEITLHESAFDISDDDWAALDHGDDPFVSRAFLGTAEKVGAGGTAMGWQAQHLALHDSGRLLGLLPLYLRTHSFGDFSRDWNWASAWQRAGLDYYPKLVSGVPYTPSPGPRLLVRRDANRDIEDEGVQQDRTDQAHERDDHGHDRQRQQHSRRGAATSHGRSVSRPRVSPRRDGGYR